LGVEEGKGGKRDVCCGVEMVGRMHERMSWCAMSEAWQGVNEARVLEFFLLTVD
jgi:hypothetical protein